MSLSDLDRAVLNFEAVWANRSAVGGRKDRAIHEAFAVTPTRHYQRVARLLGDPEVVAYAPALIYRLRRLRDHRLRRRPD